MREYRVKGSPRIRVAKMVLKTSPDCSQGISKLRIGLGGYWFGENTDCLEGGQDRERQRSDLDRASHNVRDDEHRHPQLREISIDGTDRVGMIAYLPSSTFVWRPPEVVGEFLVLEDMRLALEGQSNGLQTG